MALAEKFGNKPKVQFFEGLEWMKKLYRQVALEGEHMKEPYLAFVGATHIDPRLEKWLSTEFKNLRKKIKISSKVIQSQWEKNNEYFSYHKDNYASLVVKDIWFDLANEIVLYGENKVALMMYETHELCGLVIESKTLYQWLKSMFNLIWSIYKTKSHAKKTSS